ncbi:transposase [Streptomyces sp. NPDC056910]|uniref:transposase n=1 Tax=Streptomyces sp. NPDC056910 TaxID=3345964 RepID=UPI00369AAC25
MKLTVQVKLLPTPVQAAEIEETLRACNEAATWVSQVAFEKDIKRNFALREHTYTAVKDRWVLGAQAAQHVIKKTCDAYATLKANLKAGNLGKPSSKRYRRATEKPIAFRPEGAQPYDDRMLSWQYTQRTVSIWTLSGRMKQVAFTAAPEHLARLALCRRGESDLLFRDGMWFLIATCEVPEAELNTSVTQFLGIDLGIVNIATTSDGQIMAGRRLNRGRLRERTLRQKLQKKNTPSAKRRLKKRRRKEARRARDINHKIAKHVVAEAERAAGTVLLEQAAERWVVEQANGALMLCRRLGPQVRPPARQLRLTRLRGRHREHGPPPHHADPGLARHPPGGRVNSTELLTALHAQQTDLTPSQPSEMVGIASACARTIRF